MCGYAGGHISPHAYFVIERDVRCLFLFGRPEKGGLISRLTKGGLVELPYSWAFCVTSMVANPAAEKSAVVPV